MKTKKLIIMIVILSIGYVSNVYACDSVPTASPSSTAICTPEPADVRFIL